MSTAPQAIHAGQLSRPLRGRGILLPVGVLLFLGACFPTLLRGAAIHDARVPAAGPGLPFAIADFNGDSRPDIASVEAGNKDSASTSDYWVDVRLSGSRSRLFRLVGPSGGLHVEARDVNGDHAIDLVLSTAWLGQPVAILLNDGHGRFHRVEPTGFPEAFCRSKTKWAVSTTRAIEPMGVVQEARTASCAQVGNALRLGLDARAVPISNPIFLPVSALKSGPERAPPAEFLHL
jgi:hypothetical protein